MSDIVLHGSIYSRTFTARWILEELGLSYRIAPIDMTRQEHKSPAFLAINPMGKLPAITDNGVVVTETTAICLYLADRYGLGALAPTPHDPLRGPYLRWAVFATSVLEPAIYMKDHALDASDVGWGDYETALAALEAAVADGPWVLGERFSAADVTLGAVMSVALFNQRIPERPAIVDYNERLAARPAYQRAAEANWPPPS